jgi:hypothetical protein
MPTSSASTAVSRWEDPLQPRQCWRCSRRRPHNASGPCRRCRASLHPPRTSRFFPVQVLREGVIAGQPFAIAQHVTSRAFASAGVRDWTGGQLSFGTPCRTCGRQITLGQPCAITAGGTYCHAACHD